MTPPPVIRIAHSPDADDAFMFYGLAAGKVDPEGLTFEHHLVDIQTLNQEALKGTYELTALSYAAYPAVAEKYALLTVGSSIGDKYGPVLVAKEKFTKDQVKTKKIAVPGNLTTAYLALKLWEPSLQTVEVPFNEILDRINSGEFEAGVIIHEGQLTYAEEGFKKIVDLGEWWFETTNLVLPLGGNAIRRDLGPELIQKVARVLKASIAYGLEHREEALAGALKYARGLDPKKADAFVGMYVNDYTLDAGIHVQRAVRLMLSMGHGLGIIPNAVDPDFIGLEGEAVAAGCCP